MKFYVLFIWEDVAPELMGPYQTEQERDMHARRLKAQHGDKHGIYPLEATDTGDVTVDAYSGGFFHGFDNA